MKPWWLLLFLGQPGGPVEPPDAATLVYYNARMALGENKPTETLRLWLLHNVLAHKQGLRSVYEDDFVSLTWAALGRLGYCQDNLRFDIKGGGLWPVALHNWFLKNMRPYRDDDAPSPFDAFDFARQARKVSLHDILSFEELRKVQFYRTDCWRMKDVLVESSGSSSDDPSDPDIALRVLESLLERSLVTLSDERVRGQSVVEARLLDIRLSRMARLERKAKREKRRRRRKSKELSLPLGEGIEQIRARQIAELKTITTGWNVDDWLAIEPARRLFLFDRMYALTETPDQHQPLLLKMIDRLMADEAGQELDAWIAFLGGDASAKQSVWSGDRGKALLGLDPDTGFKERAAIALHRGVDALGTGRLPDALRAFAYALHHAGDSRQAEAIRRLGLRWLSYVSSQFEVTDDLMAMLVTLVPRGDLVPILEDLIWDAAFRADDASFERVVRAHQGRGALRRRVERLRPLARGDGGQFLTELRTQLNEIPQTSLRFLTRFVQRLQRQDGDVRGDHRDTLLALRTLLRDQFPESERRGSIARKVGTLDDQLAAMLEGLEMQGLGTARDRARGLSPTSEVFAGNIRLAPSDPLPWPFPRRQNLRAPSVLTRLPLTPIEWPDEDKLVMGWKLGQ